MREILFRGKRVDNGGWIEGFIWQLSDGTLVIGTATDFFEVDPSTVGQYTGLTDKNGRKIFEGDILKVRVWNKKELEKNENADYTKETVWTVGYKDHYCKGAGYFVYGLNRRFNKFATQSILYNANAEIIGNIHDNPELLEVTEWH